MISTVRNHSASIRGKLKGIQLLKNNLEKKKDSATRCFAEHQEWKASHVQQRGTLKDAVAGKARVMGRGKGKCKGGAAGPKALPDLALIP